MNTITLVVSILVLWIVMGLGFLAALSKKRKQGDSGIQLWMCTEGLLFAATIVGSLGYLLYHIANS